MNKYKKLQISGMEQLPVPFFDMFIYLFLH